MKLVFAFIVYNVTLKTTVHRDILFSYLLVGGQKIVVIVLFYVFFLQKKLLLLTLSTL